MCFAALALCALSKGISLLSEGFTVTSHSKAKMCLWCRYLRSNMNWPERLNEVENTASGALWQYTFSCVELWNNHNIEILSVTKKSNVLAGKPSVKMLLILLSTETLNKTCSFILCSWLPDRWCWIHTYLLLLTQKNTKLFNNRVCWYEC